MLTEKNDGWPNPRGFTKGVKGVRFVWITATSELVYRFLRCVDRMEKMILIKVYVLYEWYGFSVNLPFGQLELYVFGQD